jgi:hypothetical protein
MVTTCVSHGRPYTFPTGQSVLFFDPTELRSYVAGYVVDWMEGKARIRAHEHMRDERFAPLLGLPLDRDLPIALVARMSLSFPILLSAVKLYAIDYSTATLAEADDAIQDQSNGTVARAIALKPQPCWYVDGGLSSNFPIHLFDSPLPRWPTFGINLGRFRSDDEYDATDQTKNVWMPRANGNGLRERWTRFTGLPSFVAAMLSAIKDWNDNVQMKMPGYRDRIATVLLKETEGGLNLQMTSTAIRELARRGRAAGELLVDRFLSPSDGASPQHMGWENHRVVRYRVTMRAIQRFLKQYAQCLDAAVQPGDISYPDLIDRGAKDNFKSYPWKSASTRAGAHDATLDLRSLVRRWEQDGIDFEVNAPSPAPELVKRARS